MKTSTLVLLLIAGVCQAATEVVVPAATGEPNLIDEDAVPRIQSWFTPNFLSGFSIFLFLFLMSYLAFSALDAVQVPTYQLRATDEKNPENNTIWQDIWGNIEKS